MNVVYYNRPMVPYILTITLILGFALDGVAADFVTPVSAESQVTGFCDMSQDQKVRFGASAQPNRYASGFDIRYENDVKIVTIAEPWSGAKPMTYVLRCKSDPRSPGQLSQLYANAQVVTIPVTSVGLFATTYIGHLALLDRLSLITGVRNPELIKDPSVKKGLEATKIVNLGSGPAIDPEPVLRLRPDLCFTFVHGEPADTLHPIFAEHEIAIVINAEYLETHPLGRAEWIKFTGLFTDQDQSAQLIYDKIEQQYVRLREKVSALADANSPVTVLSGSAYADQWWIPGAQSYIAQLYRDAGIGLVPAVDGIASVSASFESIYRAAKATDAWLTANGSSLAKLVAPDPRGKLLKPYKTGRVFTSDGRGDYWERGIVNPHIMLADLIAIFHPEIGLDHQPIYYKKLR